MADTITKLSDLIDPEVMADMISAKVPKKIRVAPFAKVDDTLVGVPGDTITVPAYSYIGDAADVAEGEAVTVEKMQTSTKKTTIKKAMKGTALTDEAVLSGYGNPVGEANNQLALSIAAKLDNDCMDALQGASMVYDGSVKAIAYEGVIDAIDLFDEEVNSEKAMFIHPKQVTVLRKDPNFLSADKYTAGVALSGEIGMIANTRIVPSKKVPVIEGTPAQYAKSTSSVAAAKEVVADNTQSPTDSQIKLAAVTPCVAGYTPVVGDYVKQNAATPALYACPIVKLDQDMETEDELPALTIYLKRDTNVETERIQRKRTTEVTADKFYAVALTNESKAVLAKFKK